jgi:hypothetical protein
VQIQFSQFLFELLLRKTQVKQGGKAHVTADPGKTVEVKNFHISPFKTVMAQDLL